MKFRFAHRYIRLAGGTLLLAGLVAGPFTAGQSHAMIGICTDDPIVYLTDGTQLHVRASVSTDPSNVQSVVYNLSLPVGSSIRQVVDTGGQLSNLITVVPTFNPPAGTYTTDVFVSANVKNATATVNQNLIDNGSSKATVSGQVNQDLTISVQP